MSVPQNIELGDAFTVSIRTHDATTGAITAADANPTYRVYEELTEVAIVNGTLLPFDTGNLTACYADQVVASVANGFEIGKTYTVTIDAAVGGVAAGRTELFAIKPLATNITLGAIQVSTVAGNRNISPIPLDIFEGEAKTFTFAIKDAAGNLVDLSGMTMRCVVQDENNPRNTKFVVEQPPIAFSGAGNEIVSIPVLSTQSTPADTNLEFILWDVPTKQVLARGPFMISPANMS